MIKYIHKQIEEYGLPHFIFGNLAGIYVVLGVIKLFYYALYL